MQVIRRNVMYLICRGTFHAKPSAYAVFINFKGHILIIPKVHVPDYFDLDTETKNSLTELLDKSKIFLDETYSPDGYNAGINAGIS